MIIPEDGCLPQITRKGFAAFNNVMLIKVPEKLKKPGETYFQLATLDRSKKGEKWPADQYVDIVMNAPTSKNTNSAENFSNSNEDNNPNSREDRKRGQFRPKKFIHFSKNNQSNNICHSAPPVVPKNVPIFNPFMPNTFHDSQVPHNELQGENSVQYNERTFNDNAHTHRYHPSKFSNDHQPYGGNHLENMYHAHGQNVSATVSREPTIRNGSYNEFDSRDPPNNQHNIMISPPKPPFVDFQRNQPLYPGAFVTNPPENNFNRADILNPDFVEMGRCAEPPPFIQNIPNAYGTNNYPNEVPRNGNFEREIFPYNHSNRAEFMNNNFNMPPFHDSLKSGLNNGFNNSPMDNPPLLPFPPLPYNNFNDVPSKNFQNNFNGRNLHYGQDIWDDRNQQNSNYHRITGNGRKFNPWRGRGHNKFSKGNKGRPNNSYQRKKPS